MDRRVAGRVPSGVAHLNGAATSAIRGIANPVGRLRPHSVAACKFPGYGMLQFLSETLIALVIRLPPRWIYSFALKETNMTGIGCIWSAV